MIMLVGRLMLVRLRERTRILKLQSLIQNTNDHFLVTFTRNFIYG